MRRRDFQHSFGAVDQVKGDPAVMGVLDVDEERVLKMRFEMLPKTWKGEKIRSSYYFREKYYEHDNNTIVSSQLLKEKLFREKCWIAHWLSETLQMFVESQTIKKNIKSAFD